MPMTTLAEMFAAHERTRGQRRSQLSGTTLHPGAHLQPAQLGSELAFVDAHDGHVRTDARSAPGFMLSAVRRFAPEQMRPMRFTRYAAAEPEQPGSRPELAVRQHVAANPALSPLDYPTAGTAAGEGMPAAVPEERIFEGVEDLKKIISSRRITASDLAGHLRQQVVALHPEGTAVPSAGSSLPRAEASEDANCCMICLGATFVGRLLVEQCPVCPSIARAHDCRVFYGMTE